jgi:hypothetical protein
VARTVDEVHADHAGAGGLLHPLEGARILVRSPVAAPGDVHGRLIDCPAGEELDLGRVAAAAAAVALESALEPGAAVLLGVDAQLAVGQPPVCRDLGG